MKKAILSALALLVTTSTYALPLEKLHLPKGFSIEVYANVPGARSITIGDENIIYVGSLEKNTVYAVLPPTDEKQNATVVKLATGLNAPNGVLYHNGDLYVAEINRLIKFADITHHIKDPKFTVINDKLPNKRHHGYRYIRMSRDGWLYMSIGAPCNVCISDDPIFGTIIRMRPDGSEREIYATGVRNSVGFDWNPIDQKLWFTENGRDMLGDNQPPDELNTAPTKGLNFGFPYFYGDNVPDPEFGKMKSPQDMKKPAVKLGPHVAAIGMSFYQGNILIAEHGSWNRSKKSGYRVTQVTFKDNKPVSYTPFITGWLQGEIEWGRPVDIKVLNLNTIFFSDDTAGVIYRLKKSY